MVTISEQEGVCQVLLDGETVYESPVAFDPRTALELLLEINRLRDVEGKPIYGNYLEGNHACWAMLQEHLFWSYLQPFVKYRAIIEWLLTHQVKTVETDIEALKPWQELLFARTAGPTGRLRHRIEWVLLMTNAAVVGIWLRFRRMEVLLWSLNSVGNGGIDFRLKDVCSELWKRRIPFVEGFPFPGFKVILRRLLGSRRIALYVPNIIRLDPPAAVEAERHIYGWSSVEGMPRELLEKLVRRFELLAANAIHQARTTNRLLGLAGIRQLIGIDEHTSYAPLILAARKRKIETMGLQHGAFHKYMIGWTTPGIPSAFTVGYDRILVWGDFWRDLLAELSSTYGPERLEPAGFIRPSTIKLNRQEHAPERDPFRILLPYEFQANPNEIAEFVEAFLDCGFEVVFKVRWDDTLDDQLRMLPRERMELAPELTQEVIDSVHVCAGTSTTLMYELYCLHVPIWFLRTRHDSNVHMVDKGLANEITLSALRSPGFDPFENITWPSRSERIFSPTEMPAAVAEHLLATLQAD